MGGALLKLNLENAKCCAYCTFGEATTSPMLQQCELYNRLVAATNTCAEWREIDLPPLAEDGDDE